ncbi:hypothetical protein GCM10009696_33460 [Kocuria himachalensis]
MTLVTDPGVLEGVGEAVLLGVVFGDGAAGTVLTVPGTGPGSATGSVDAVLDVQPATRPIERARCSGTAAIHLPTAEPRRDARSVPGAGEEKGVLLMVLLGE